MLHPFPAEEISFRKPQKRVLARLVAHRSCCLVSLRALTNPAGARGVSGMFDASGSTRRQAWSAASGPVLSPSFRSDAAFLLALRFFAHLSYFKAASLLTLPQGLSTAGAVVTALVYALACLVTSRWIAGLRRTAAEPPHPAALPLLGTTAILLSMLVMGPAIAMLLPREGGQAASLAGLLPGYFGLLGPVCALFFTAQLLTDRRSPFRFG